jgi:hypothetical protein
MPLNVQSVGLFQAPSKFKTGHRGRQQPDNFLQDNGKCAKRKLGC